MSTIIRIDAVVDGYDVAVEINGNLSIFHFDHEPAQGEINTAIADYESNQQNEIDNVPD